MVSKTRKKTRKLAEAIREMFSTGSEAEDIQNHPRNHTNNDPPLDNPTSTFRLVAENQFKMLSQKLDTRISKGLTSTLTEFALRLEAALESHGARE